MPVFWDRSEELPVDVRKLLFGCLDAFIASLVAGFQVYDLALNVPIRERDGRTSGFLEVVRLSVLTDQTVIAVLDTVFHSKLQSTTTCGACLKVPSYPTHALVT